jgi:hypothetical protein
LLAQHLGTNRLVGPVHVGLRIRLLGDQPVHDSCALGFFSIINRSNARSGVTLKILEYRFRKDLVLADYGPRPRCLREETRSKPPPATSATRTRSSSVKTRLFMLHPGLGKPREGTDTLLQSPARGNCSARFTEQPATANGLSMS